MSALFPPLSPDISHSRARRETVHERRDRYRGALKISTPVVSEEQRKRWFGAPPSKLNTKRPSGTFSF